MFSNSSRSKNNMDKSDTVTIFRVQLSGLDTSYLISKSSFRFFVLIPWNGLDTFHDWPVLYQQSLQVVDMEEERMDYFHSIGIHESGIDFATTSVE